MSDNETIRLQWIKGDKIGNVETVETEDGEWTLFESGGRINSSLINEFMIPVGEDELDFDPPTPALQKAASMYKERVKPEPKQISPIRTLLDKQKKLNKHKISVSLPINIISSEMYDLLSNSFGEDEVTQELLSFIEDQIKTENVIELIQESIQSLIQSKYNGE